MQFFKRDKASSLRRSRKSLDKSDIPSRQSSLARQKGARADESEGNPEDQVDVPKRRSSLDQSELVAATKSLSISGNLAELGRQRQELVTQVVSEARENALKPSHAGLQVFEAAGLPIRQGSLEVTTRWVQPVIQETIIPREHIETTTVVNREIHKHHVYPKIQPISDPDPIVLETRHRICGPDGRWHEVIGDAAAIEILGEEAFYGGEKVRREKRGPALPGLEQDGDKLAVWGDKDGQYSYKTDERRTLSMEL